MPVFYMKKVTQIITCLLLMTMSSCLKAYVAPIETPTVPSKMEEVPGIYKSGALTWELGFLDSLNYKGVSDSSGFSIVSLSNDSVFISMDTKAFLGTKRFKIAYSSRTEMSHSTISISVYPIPILLIMFMLKIIT